ncbi:jupiter microtubule associated homolog 2 isoform X2 [Rhinatrema bivittatum]|uniref:jupiter microtubule associated homolog 2 isoform X2 n=1 Tax=Rhinatrema bivittatum TaxID=194408 RepID=UPI001125D594|nr:jupiter microtubule associated homolog 2 isoform X2 [Rhinatrema bivittatum]
MKLAVFPIRVLKSEGGSNSPKEDPAPTKSHKMASDIFGSPAESQNVPKKSNPPGGKESGIFQASNPVHVRQRPNPPGGKTSDIFGDAVSSAAVRPHPNKPKDNICLREGDTNLCVKAVENIRLQEDSEREKRNLERESTTTMNDHEPRLGPRPRCHNRVLNPPGGKSNITFY